MYINLYTLRKIGEKLGVQGNSKQELLNAILNKLEIEIENSTLTLPRRVEMVNVLTGEELYLIQLMQLENTLIKIIQVL